MIKDIKLLVLEIKTHLIAYLCPVIIIYTLFIPYIIYQIQYIQDKEALEVTYFMLSQQYLILLIILYQWLILRNYIDRQLVEVIFSNDSLYKVRFSFYSLLLYLIVLIPYFILTYIRLGPVYVSMVSFMFQLLILSLLFYGISFVLRNTFVTTGLLIIFTLLFTRFYIIESPYILFHTTTLAKNLDTEYWIIQIFIAIIITLVGIYIEKKKLNIY